MGIIFGKKKRVSRVTEQDKAVLQLKQQRDKLKQYQKKIELALITDRELARKLLNDGKKDRAKLLLRKKRFQEQLLLKTDGQLENLERLTHDIEFAQVEIQVVAGLKEGNEALKKINCMLDLEDIEQMLEETRAGAEKQREIDSLISGTLTDDDELAVEEELNEIIEQSLPDIPTDVRNDVAEPSLPEVPSASIEEKEPEKQRIRKAVALEA